MRPQAHWALERKRNLSGLNIEIISWVTGALGFQEVIPRPPTISQEWASCYPQKEQRASKEELDFPQSQTCQGQTATVWFQPLIFVSSFCRVGGAGAKG